MFALCDGMQWNHLPVAGGIFNQHPQLLDDFLTIFQVRGDYERKKAAKEKAESERKNRPGVMKGRRR